MPNYDYVCDACGNTFEVFQSMNDPRLTVCPDETCGGAVKRKIGTGAGIIFKGSGFYATDYRSSAYSEAAKKDKPESGDKSKKKEAATAKAGGGCCGGGACAH